MNLALFIGLAYVVLTLTGLLVWVTVVVWVPRRRQAPSRAMPDWDFGQPSLAQYVLWQAAADEQREDAMAGVLIYALADEGKALLARDRAA